tara:strand:+ start:337 stop:747 length:411 start_codon:yes stop_codon:yes gene_type:complete
MANLVPKIYPNDLDVNTPIGIGFPLNVGTPNHNYNTTAQVHDNLRNLILTIKGERPMQPNFGSDVYLLVFEQLYEDDLAQAARQAIKEAVREWMPALTIEEVQVTANPDNNKILIEVNYLVQGWPASDSLNLTVNI